jgi:DMSO reductase anchor subunit
MRDRGFHEFPLVLFTSMAIAGSGLAAACLVLWMLRLCSWPPTRVEAATVAMLLSGGLAVSVLHLGRKTSMVHALRRTGRSRLSTEILLATTVTASAWLASIIPAQVMIISPLWLLISFSSLGLLVLMAMVYRLPGQLSWGGVSSWIPVVTGLAFGALAKVPAVGDSRAYVIDCVLVLLAIDAGLLAGRWRRLEMGPGAPSHRELFASRRLILSLRLAISPLLTALSLVLGHSTLALQFLAIGILADRFSFYALGLRHTTETEIARVEAIIRTVSGEPAG